MIGVLAAAGLCSRRTSGCCARLGAALREVRVPADLDGLDGLVIPGGESTTMTLGIEREGLAEPLRELAREGRPVLGSCAGLIMLDREHLGLMDIARSATPSGARSAASRPTSSSPGSTAGRCAASSSARPWIAEHGPGVEILAEVDGHPVAARQGHMLAVAFHAELTEDDRLHRLFLESVAPAAECG